MRPSPSPSGSAALPTPHVVGPAAARGAGSASCSPTRAALVAGAVRAPTTCSGRSGTRTAWPRRLERTAARRRTGRRAGRPRPRRRRRALRRSRRATPSGSSAAGVGRLPRRARGPADPGRHARRAGHPRRRRAGAHRAPQQGPRVGRSSWSSTSRRTSGPTCATAARCSSRAARRRRADRAAAARRRCSAEERRLFYVAVTRARRRLVVTAVDSPEDDGARPSRFLAELGRPGPGRGRPAAPAADPGRAGRRAAARSRPTPSRPSRCAQAAAERLARLAPARPRATSRWCPPRTPTAGGASPTSPTPSEPSAPRRACRIPLSGSSLAWSADCPLRWFLAHEAHGRERAQHRARLRLGRPRARRRRSPGGSQPGGPRRSSMALVDRCGTSSAFEARWRSDRSEHAHARTALARFLPLAHRATAAASCSAPSTSSRSR